jgi:hypothetical protein
MGAVDVKVRGVGASNISRENGYVRLLRKTRERGEQNKGGNEQMKSHFAEV